MTPETALTRPPSFRWFRVYVGWVVFSMMGMTLGRVTGLDPGWIAPIAGALTLLSGVAAVIAPVVSALGMRPALLRIGGVLAVGAGSEVLGLYTGFPFGSYVYTERWWPTVPMPGDHRFPLLLPFAWLMMAGAAALWVSRVAPGWPRWAVAVGGGLVAALADVPMEPVMTDVLGYWTWTPKGPILGAPVMNFFGWFLTATVAGWILGTARTRESAAQDPGPGRVLAVHLSFVVFTGLLGRGPS